MTTLRQRTQKFFADEKLAYPALAEQYGKLQVLEERRLWHELTEELRKFVADPACNQDQNLVKLYEKFVKQFHHKINQLHFVEIMIGISKQLYSDDSDVNGLEAAITLLVSISGCSSVPEPKEAAKAASSTGDDASNATEAAASSATSSREVRMQKRRKLGDGAFVVVQSHVALLRLKQNRAEDALALLEQTKPILDALECAPPVVHRAYFGVASEYHAAKGPPDAYYRNRLQDMVYTPIEELSDELRIRYAQDLCLAALVSDDIYNFGEVVALPIFETLKQSKEHAWLSEWLQCFHEGDIERFNDIYDEYQHQIQQKAALRCNLEKLKHKITILCLMELIFKRPPASRNIPFADVAQATRLGVDQVEWLLMRAMSLGLVKGVIDEVNQTVNVTYIQPRVLDKAQLKDISGKLKQWSEAVQETVTFMESNTTELFA